MPSESLGFPICNGRKLLSAPEGPGRDLISSLDGAPGSAQSCRTQQVNILRNHVLPRVSHLLLFVLEDRAACSWLSSPQPSIHQGVSPPRARAACTPGSRYSNSGRGGARGVGTGFKGGCLCQGLDLPPCGAPQKPAWGAYKQELSFQGPGASVSCKRGVCALCWPSCSLHLRLWRLPAPGSGKQMSIKGGVSKLGGPSERVHACLADGGQRPCVGQGACKSRNSGSSTQHLEWGGEPSPRRALTAGLRPGGSRGGAG